jgi:hypothetical protein
LRATPFHDTAERVKQSQFQGAGRRRPPAWRAKQSQFGASRMSANCCPGKGLGQKQRTRASRETKPIQGPGAWDCGLGIADCGLKRGRAPVKQSQFRGAGWGPEATVRVMRRTKPNLGGMGYLERSGYCVRRGCTTQLSLRNKANCVGEGGAALRAVTFHRVGRLQMETFPTRVSYSLIGRKGRGRGLETGRP